MSLEMFVSSERVTAVCAKNHFELDLKSPRDTREYIKLIKSEHSTQNIRILGREILTTRGSGAK